MRNTRNAFTIIVLLIALLLPCFWPARSAQAAPTLGFVAARGRVLDAQGNPIWAEYDTDGSVIRDIEYSDPEALKTARVISAGSYRAYVAAFNAIEQEYGAVSEVLTRAEYDARVFTKPDQSPAIKPLLKKDTACVVVRRANLIYTDNISLILLESPLYLKPVPAIPDNAQAVLLGSDGQVLAASENNIGYRVAYYTLQGSTESFDGASRVAYGMGYRSNTPDYQWGQDSMFGFNEYEDQLRGPMMGVQVNGWFDTTYTDQNGAFEVQGAPFTYTAQAKLRYSVWDPQGGITGVYLLNHPALATWKGRCKFEVDVAIVTGAGLFYNSVNRPGAGPKGYLAQAEATTYAYTPPLVLPVLPEPGATRLPDQPPDFGDQGLLQTISKQDIDNTDIYVYRLSNDMLITSREGLAGHEWIPKYFTSQYAGAITFHMMIRAGGSFGDSLDIGLAGGGKVWNYDTFQELTNVHESLRPVNADHLRTGEQLKVILINRATGYIGTGIGIVGQKYFAGATGAEVQADSVDVYMGQIQMQPPNLKIKAERVFAPQAGLTAGRQQQNIIGFEGSGLTSDQYIRVTTELFDHDGTPLPAELPGFTGRLAKVAGQNQLAAVGGQVANFEIKSGLHTQMVVLPRKKVDDAHFYIHVNGEPPEGNPNFSETGAAPTGPLQYRPKHYVPFQVPVFNESATLAIAQAQAASLKQNYQGGAIPVLENIEKVYQWPYRPEMQFSLFDLEIDDLEMVTAFNGATGKAETSVTFNYDLIQNPSYNPLDPLGTGRDLVFGLGYAEIAAMLGSNQQAQFASIDELLAMSPVQQYQYVSDMLNDLKAEDFLGLQLYQNNDAGNQLAEIYGLPMMSAKVKKPFRLLRQYYMGQFDSSVPGGIGAGYTDDYEEFEFQMFAPADVTVNLLDADGALRTVLIPTQRLSAGPTDFIVDFTSVVNAGFNNSNRKKFVVELIAKAADGLRTQKVEYPGVLEERSEGQMLGQIMVHDVLIQDGSLNLSRTDLSLPGRGPELAFSRTYNNLTPARGFQPLGPGWSHNYEHRLQVHSSTDYNTNPIPVWAMGLKGRFFRPSEIPAPTDQWTSVTVNGTLFKKYNGAWYPERGRHGTLIEGAAEFTYIAKDGTRYYYNNPKRTKKTGGQTQTSTSLHVGDSLVTRIDLDPRLLLVPIDQPPMETTTSEMPGPSPVKRIADRNGNTMTFDYDLYDRLTKVTDAVGRTLNFSYQLFGGRDERLTQVTGPDNIQLNFTYDANNMLQSATRANRTETYSYTIESGGVAGAGYNLTAATDANHNPTSYAYYQEGELPSSMPAFIKALHAYV